jgi:sterol desaturase/sphingolipid hydroxylase (fatty acid hydroxylase superfamily)
MHSELTQSMTSLQPVSQSLEYLVNVLLIIILAEVFVDYFSHRTRNYRETFANFGVGLVDIILSNTIGAAVGLFALLAIAQFRLFTLEINIWTWILAVLLTDFMYYWWHRMEHRVRFMWASHSVHHSSTDYDLSTALRLPWIEDSLLLWIMLVPVVLLGFNPLQALIASEIVGNYQIWIHNQKIGKLGILDKILNTPSVHRVHHGANPRYIDKNYGGILIIWDRLFGTYEPESEKVVYGLTNNINTHNPIKINWIEFSRLWSDVHQSQGTHEVFKSIFGAPEWKPRAVKSAMQLNKPVGKGDI